MATAVTIVEPKTVGTWGERAQFALPAGAIPAETVIGPQILCDIETAGEYGEPLTVVLSGALTELWCIVAPAGPEVELVAVLDYSASGAVPTRAVVDVVNGMVLQIVAKKLTINAYAHVYHGGVMPAAAQTEVQAYVTRGIRGQTRAQRTVHSEAPIIAGAWGTVFPLTGLPALSPQGIFLPPPAPPAPAINRMWRTVTFARRCRLNCEPNNAAVVLWFISTGGAILGQPIVAWPSEEFDIPNGAIGWCLHNVGGVAVTRYEMTYFLDL